MFSFGNPNHRLLELLQNVRRPLGNDECGADRPGIKGAHRAAVRLNAEFVAAWDTLREAGFRLRPGFRG